MPFLLFTLFTGLILPLQVHSCSHARSVVWRHVRGLIRLASFNKDGPVSREGMATIIELRMPEGTIDCAKIYRGVEQTAILRLASTSRNIQGPISQHPWGSAYGNVPRVQT